MIGCHFVRTVMRRALLIAALLILPQGASATDVPWKAGVARAIVTPQKPLWMAGYGGRTEPASGKQHDLYVRALVLEDAEGHRGVVLASDLLGIPKTMYDQIYARLHEQFGLERAQILLHSSHTHCGPVLDWSLQDIYPMSAEQRKDVEEYAGWLVLEIVSVIGKAIDDLKPATVSKGFGRTGFAVNRRTNREPDVPELRQQNRLMGPVDHSVPVMVVNGADGSLKAVLFIYACHNTTLSYQKWCGDYAGFAQFALESKHPGISALFCMGCGADQNPLPRRTVELAEQYGNELAAEVESILKRTTFIRPKLEMKHMDIPLAMEPLPPLAQLEKMAAEPASYSQRWASRLLTEVKNGVKHPPEYPYPIQVWRLGGEQLWISMGGEVVVDYALRLKAEYGDQTWVSAYANDVMAYIPSKRVLLEGGYEGQSSMMVYGLPTDRWKPDVEERIVEGIRQTIQQIEQP